MGSWALVLLLISAASAQFGVNCGTSAERFALLCSNPQPKANGCAVTGKVVLPPPWLQCEWSSPSFMVVHEGASITCANRTARREYNDDLSQVTTCELAFRFDGGIGMQKYASIKAGTVKLDSARGKIEIADGAVISATGMGLCGREPLASSSTFEDHFGFGEGSAGHGGHGGQCSGGSIIPGTKRSGTTYGDAAVPGITDPGDPPWRRQIQNQPFFADLYGSGTSLGWQMNPSGRCCGGSIKRPEMER